MALVSVATARSYSGAHASDDTLLTILRDGVVAWLERWIPGHLGTSATLTEILDGPQPLPTGLTGEYSREAEREARRIQLAEEIDLDDLEAIEFRDSLDLDWYDHDEDDPSDFTDFELDGLYLIRRTWPWPVGDRLIRVQYTHGFAEDAGPADVRLVALESIRALWRTRASQGLRAAAIGPMSVSFESIVRAGVSPAMLNGIRRSQY